MTMQDVNHRDELGATKLFEAVSDQSTKLVERLLKQGADPNIPENNGTTPLMEAASGEDIAIIDLLLASGAKLDAQDHFGDTALDYARNNGCKKAEAYLKAKLS